jgi:uncharacterized cupin superfamily protein
MTDATALAQRLIRNVDDVDLQRHVREPLYESRRARLATGTAARRLGATVVVTAPGKRAWPYHLHHAEEEMFVILEGSGTLRVAGELLPLRRGDVVFLPAGKDYPHQIINTSDAPLKYLAISGHEPVEICEYPDSDKFMADAVTEGRVSFSETRRRGPSLDDWDGEP